MDALDKFERELSEGIQTKEYATAPNGASYRVDTKNGMLGCWRFYPWQKQATFYVGFSSERFESVETVIRWAVCDGRHEPASEGTELSKRKLIA